MVADLDRALRLYRDVLGLTVWKTGEGTGNEAFFRLLGCEPARGRFAILQAEDSETGMVGLFEVSSPAPPALERGPDPGIRLGEVALVFLARDVQSLAARVAALGLTVVCPPLRFPVPGGGTALETTFRDFDGALVNLVEPL
jgi:catechol 2,3-dioxygenase-like lactoylglutathione lyase family enzyme